MNRRNPPFALFPHSPDDLVRAISFGDIEAMAAELGVDAGQLAYWRSGREPVPKVVYLYLSQRSRTTLGDQFGPFRGFRLCPNTEALVCPATGERLHYNDVHQLREYRRAVALVAQQAELIERLMKERDFYKANCHKQAKFGAFLNSLFPD